MKNKSTTLPYLVMGILLIVVAVLMAWMSGDNTKFAISSLLLVTAGGICCLVSCVKYLRERNERDFFHLE